MSKIDQDILLEALSALTGATVKSLADYKGGSEVIILALDNYLPNVFRLQSNTQKSNPLFVSPLQASPQQSGASKTAPGSASAPPNLMTTLSLTSRLQPEATALQKELFVDMDEFFEPKFDCDFRRRKDPTKCYRGGELYTRPWGWYRFALKVLNRYPDGNDWLGQSGWRSQGDAKEWPVSFHGTGIEGAKGITSSQYSAGPRQAYGRGIYSTPDIQIADAYSMSKTFTSKKNGKTYKTIMQNRVNPPRRVKTAKKDYWLVEIPDGTSPAEEKRIVEESIRPYGILIKEV